MLGLDLLVGAWLLITSAGLVYGIRLVRRAKKALLWLHQEQLNGYREIVATGAIRRGNVRVAIFVCMVSMGVLTVIAQFYAAGSPPRLVISAAFRLLFIFMAIAFTWKSYMENAELDRLLSESQRLMARTRSGDGEASSYE